MKKGGDKNNKSIMEYEENTGNPLDGQSIEATGAEDGGAQALAKRNVR